MDEVREYRQRLCASLERQPEDYRAAFAALPPERWHAPNVLPGGYSAHQHVAHVREVEVQAFVARLHRILHEERPILEAFPTHNWTEALYQPTEPLATILDDFARARAEAVHMLRPLPDADWARMAFHLPSGKRTLQWWVERAYAHARTHLTELLEIDWHGVRATEKMTYG